jgi:hypothetical protein
MLKLTKNNPGINLVKKHKIETALILGILVRLLLIPISGHPEDMAVWYNLSLRIVSSGPFSVSLFPPVQSYFLLIPISFFHNWLSPILHITATPIGSLAKDLVFYPGIQTVVPDRLFIVLIKLPMLITDICGAFLIGKIFQRILKRKDLGQKAMVFWFLNPCLIWISAVWGMWDSVAVFFSLLSVYFLLTNRVAFSSISLFVGIITKMYPLFFVFPFAIYLIRRRSRVDVLKFFAVLFALFIIFIPFLPSVETFFYDYFSPNVRLFDSLTNPPAFGLTYWSLMQVSSLPSTQLFFQIIAVVSSVLTISCLVFVYYRIYKMNFKLEISLFLSLFIIISAVFLSYRLVLEQWFVWLLPLLIILLTTGKINEKLFWGLSFLAFSYSILNCPFPLFFLPLAPYASTSLVSMMHIFWAIWDFRSIYLIIAGCLFSVFLFYALYLSIRKDH